MNVNWNSSASAAQWGNYQPHKQAETTGTIAKNNDPVFKFRQAETAGAVAMFNGLDGTQTQGRFMAVA